MVLYGLALTPLAESLFRGERQLMQAWYADDCALYGPVSAINRAMNALVEYGPDFGYYPEPEKSVIIADDNVRDEVKARLAHHNFRYEAGARYIGAFAGSRDARLEWLRPQIDQWVYGIERLAMVARTRPQEAFAGLTRSLQSEWTYAQRVCPDLSDEFEPVEQALRETFLPALLGETGGIDNSLRELLGLSTKSAGAGIRDPRTRADAEFRASRECSEELVNALVLGKELDIAAHEAQVEWGRINAREARAEADSEIFLRLAEQLGPEAKRRMERAKHTGGWLNILPQYRNGTVLSAGEFRDSIRIRFGLSPLNMPSKCDGCGSKFTLGHAMKCGKGGLVILRHNEVASEWSDLCATALSASAVSIEPSIHNDRTAAAAATNVRGREPNGNTVPIDARADVGVRNFWARQQTALFDVRVVDTDQPSYAKREPSKVLNSHEQAKKKKYLELCKETRRSFTPLVFSVDGMFSAETSAATKRLASHLSRKWGRQYSDVCGYVRCRLQLSLVRSTHVCVRGERYKQEVHCKPQWVGGAGLSLTS